MPIVLLGVVLFVAAWAVRREIRRLRDELDRTTKRALREHERAEELRMELLAERERAAPPPRADTVRTLLEASDLRNCATRDDVARRVGRAVVTALDPEQWMVLVAADDAGAEFVIGASGCKDGEPVWPAGARIDSQVGRVGLAVRRRGTLDMTDFTGQTPVVREQMERTEPGAFHVDVAAPGLANDRVVAVLTVGGSSRPLGETRAALDAFARATASALAAVRSAPEREPVSI